jgi:putative PIN family toxin of toxin-antitoxin system
VRVVVDPNVLVSSRISSLGHPARIARAADEGRFELIVSERLLSELRDVLMRERFRRYATVEEVEDLLAGLRERGVLFEEDAEVERVVPDDPKDDYLVALARASGAARIVSGDPHLTNLEGKDTPEVMTPREFWELLEREPDA